MIRMTIRGPNFEDIRADLDRVSRPPLGTLAMTLKEIMIEDNRDGLLAGLNANGDPADELMPSTIRRGRGGDGPPRVPRGDASRLISGYGVEVFEDVWKLTLVGSWSDAPFVPYIDYGTRHMVARELIGIRPSGQEKIAEAVDHFIADLIGGF